VFIQKGDIYEAQPISTGRRDTEFVEVTAGLSGGETIVINQSFLIKADIEKSAAVHDH
jgi:cobalt-zinc-cadmium efflux system membrane fusion protein